jgi:molecular chaperone GrpE
MQSRDDSGFDPARGQPESENAFADGGGPAAEDDYQVADSGVGGEALTELQRRLNEQQEKYLRLAAEYENYRKRSMRERSETYSKAQADLVKQLLDALDDLARFAHVDPAAVDSSTVVQGAEMVEKKTMKVLANAGLEAINPVNQTFDPKVHEAVATEPALSPEDDHVVARVFQVGYLFNGQLLRPARVVVKQWNG